MFSIVILCALLVVCKGFRISSKFVVKPRLSMVVSRKDSNIVGQNPIKDLFGFIGDTVSQVFSKTDHTVVPELVIEDIPKFSKAKGWKLGYKKHNWESDDAAQAFAKHFILSDFDYWVVKEPTSHSDKDVVRVYGSDPAAVGNPAKYIAFGVTQGLSPIDRDPEHVSEKTLPPFKKALHLSELRKALKGDPFFQ